MVSPVQRFTVTLFLSTLYLSAAPLSLNEAISLLKEQNLEIKAASLDAQNAKNDVSLAQGYNYGALDFTQNAVRSNEALNVFGFKLSSREASFGDFGLAEYSGDIAVQPNRS